jgi:hypothetical protein
MVLAPTWIIGVSGHRAIDEARVTAALKDALGRLRKALPESARLEFLASLAEGTDQLVLREVRAAGHRTHVVLPMEWSALLEDLEGPAATAAELQQASSVRQAPGRGLRPACYADANTELVLASDALLAVWDGQPSRGVGGTAEVVAQARAFGLPLVWIHSETGAIEVERFEALDTEPNTALLAKAAEILQTPQADRALATRVRSGLWRTLLVGLAASVVGAGAAAIGGSQGLVPEFAWVALMVAQLVFATWLFLERRVIAKRVPVQTWLEHRFAVEVLASTRAAAGLTDPLLPALATVEPRWRRFAVSASTSMHAERDTRLSWEQLRDRYVAERLLGGRGQAPYFEAVGQRAEREAARQARLSRLAAAVTLGATLFSLVWKGTQLLLHLAHTATPLEGNPVLAALVRFLPAALPAVAASVLSVEFLFDRKRRAATYPLLARHLHTLAQLLRLQTSEDAARRLVTECERLVLTEVQEWRASEERASGKSVSAPANG